MKYEVELDSNRYGVEVFQYDTRQAAESGFSRVIDSARFQTARDSEKRVVRLVITKEVLP